MKAFPFSLDGAALDWLEEMPVGYIISWEKLAQEFLQKFYPATWVLNMRSQLVGIRQNATETYAEYYVRFQKLQKICPQHGFSKGRLLHFFYQGFLEATVNELQYGNREMSGVNQGAGSDQRLSKIEENIEKLIVLMLSGKTSKGQVCGICSTPGYFTDVCPTLMDPSYEDVNVVGFSNQGGNKFSNTYNPRWRDHSNLRYGNTSNALNGFQFQNTSTPLGFQQRGQGSQNIGGDSNIEKLLSKFVDRKMEMQKQCTTNSQDIKEMQKQLRDVIKKIYEEHEPKRLPGTTYPNMKFEHENIITTKSGRNVIPTRKNEAESEHKKLEEQTSPKSADKSFNSSNPIITNSRFDYVPFPARLVQTKKSALETNILETFRKVNINLPLLECIQNLPAYAKVLKYLCTKWRRLKGREVIEMKENVSAVLQGKLPTKCKDPGSFTIPCTIGNSKFENALLDLGTSINVMPSSLYEKLCIKTELKTYGVTILVADRSHVHLKGVLEDVLVQVGRFQYLAYFYILDMGEAPKT
ncbi:uncharacterized protein LOC141679891 [Apium graveolens]|uniref:uncharacterized protein LOC141679891 n=1 Tax=Apium graveolens TaxID=4045 RepID=UPI003D792E04